MRNALYNSSEVQQLLRDLQPFQDPIEQASTTFIQLGESGFQKRLVEDWTSNFRYYSSSEHVQKRTSLLYLVNDIVQKCKNKVPAYLDLFKEALSEAFKLLVRIRDEQTIQVASSLLELWKKRKIYSTEVVNELSEILTDRSTLTQESTEKSGFDIPEGLIRVPPEIVSFTDNSKELEKWKQRVIEAELKLRNILGEDNFNEDEANVALSEYKKYLEYEQKYRTKLLKDEMELMRQLDMDHVKYTHNLKKIGTLIDEIEQL